MPTTDPTFYRSPGAAVAAAPEQLAYVAAFDPAGQKNDALAVVDCDPNSSTLRPGGRLVRTADGRQRTAPLRLERLLERAVSRRACRPRSSGAISSSLVSGRRTPMSSTPSPTRETR